MTTAPSSRRHYFSTTLITATIAATAAAATLMISLPVWAMFIGWIAFFTRGLSGRSAVENLGCVGIGMCIGVVASLVIQQLGTLVGQSVALPIVVFLVALLVVALRGLPMMNNLLGYFLGLVAWFAAHLAPSAENLLQLFSASTIGSIAGWIAYQLSGRIANSAQPRTGE